MHPSILEKYLLTKLSLLLANVVCLWNLLVVRNAVLQLADSLIMLSLVLRVPLRWSDGMTRSSGIGV